MRELLDKLHLLENSKRYVPVKGSIIQQDIRKLIGNRKDIYIDSSANDRTVNVVQVDPQSGRVYQRYMVGVRSTPPLFRKIKKFLQTSPQQNFKTVPQIQQQFTPPAGDIPDGGSSDVDGTNQAGTNQDGNADNTGNGSTVGPPLSTDRVDGPIGQVDPNYGASPNRPPVSVPTITNPDSSVTIDPNIEPVDGIDSLDNQPGLQQFDEPATDDTATVQDFNIPADEYSDDDPGNMQQLQRPEVEPKDEPEVEPKDEPEDNQQNTPQDTTQAPLISRQEFNGEFQIKKVGGLIPGIPAVWKIVRYRESIGSGGLTPQDEVISEHPTKKEAEAARDKLYNDYIQKNSNDRPEQGSNNSQPLGTQVLNTNIKKYNAPTTAINIIFDKESSGNIDSAPGDGGASLGGMQVMTDPHLKGAIDEWIRHEMSDDTIDDIKKDKKLQMEIGVWYYTLLYTLLGGKGTPRKRKLAYKAQNLHKDFKKYRTKDHTINFTDKSTLIIPKGIDPRFVYAAMMYNGGPDEVNTKTGVAKLATKRYAKDFLKRLKDIKGISDSNQFMDRILILSGIDKYKKLSQETNVEKQKITEASMNVSMNGASAGEVAELMALLKNAGMPEPKSMAVMAPSGMSPGPIKTSGCGCGSMGEDTVEEEYANEPDETTMDTAYMTKDLAGGLNRPKDKGALRAKDPAIDHSEMRESLRKALEAKYIQEIDIPKDDSAASNMPTQKAPSMKGLPCPSRGYSEQQIKALRKKLEMAMQDKKRPWQSAAFALEKILKMTNHCYDHAEIVVDKLMDKIRAANGGEFPKKKGFFGGIFDSTNDNTSTELESISKLAGIK